MVCICQAGILNLQIKYGQKPAEKTGGEGDLRQLNKTFQLYPMKNYGNCSNVCRNESG